MTHLMMPLRRYLPLLLLGVLACSARPVPEAALDRQTRVALPAPWPAPLHYRQQLLTVALPGSNHDGQSLMTVLTVQPQGLRLQGLTPLGVPLFRIDYDAAGIHSSTLPGLAPGVGAMPPAAQVLADVMLAYWPLASWQARLPAGWSLTETPDSRLLRNPAGERVTEINYVVSPQGREPSRLTQHVFGYQLILRTLASRPTASGGEE